MTEKNRQRREGLDVSIPAWMSAWMSAFIPSAILARSSLSSTIARQSLIHPPADPFTWSHSLSRTARHPGTKKPGGKPGLLLCWWLFLLGSGLDIGCRFRSLVTIFNSCRTDLTFKDIFLDRLKFTPSEPATDPAIDRG